MSTLSKDKILDIIKNRGTPLYIFDIAELKKRAYTVKEILGPETAICYAMKANPFLISYLNEVVDRFEVCSPGEYSICREEEISTEKIVLSGVYKSNEDIENTFCEGFNGIYTFESESQYEKIMTCARERRKRVRGLPRLTSGNQFGMDRELIRQILSSYDRDNLELMGIHYFSGTQKKNMDVLERELAELDEFCTCLARNHGCEIREIEFGAGLYYDYFSDKDPNYEDCRRLKELLDRYRSKYHFSIELGRYLTASCGHYVTRVVDVKKNKDRNYCIVDGGIHHLNYYGQLLGVKVPRVERIRTGMPEGVVEKWTVCGALCTIHDIILKDFQMDQIDVGDIFVFHDVGAYSVTETGYLFLSRELPELVAIDGEGTTQTLRRRTPAFPMNTREKG